MALYIDLATVKKSLGITDEDRDVQVTQAIAAASSSIDNRCGRTFGRDEDPVTRVFRTRGRTVRDEGGELLLIDDIATVDGLVVEVGDTNAWTPVATWETSPDNALVKGKPVTGLLSPYSWWSASRRVRVTAAWGWPAVPDDIAQAALLQSARLYRRKDSPEGIAGSAEWGLIRMPNLDPDVRALVEPFRLSGFGGEA